MGVSNAEKMRKYRQSLKTDPAKYEQYLEKERRRYKRRKEKGEIRVIDDCTDREKKLKRRKWKIEKRERRKKKKEETESLRVVTITPPQSPIDETNSADRQRHAGRRAVRRDRAKAYKEINKLKVKLQMKSREAEKYRKRYERLQRNSKATQSPRKYLNAQLKHSKVRESVRKELLFNCVVAQEIRRKMALLNTEREKQIVSKIVTLSVLKKYNLSHFAQKLGISSKRLRANAKRDKGMVYQRKTNKNRIGVQVRKKVCEFLEEDIHSRALPGKKDMISRKGLKKPKRLLSDSLKNLHKKFVKENPLYPMSYTTFCKLRPFWVVHQKCSDRDTCGCKLHLNAAYIVDRLVGQKVLESASITDACKSVVCDIESKACMYGECGVCKDKKIELGDMEHNRQVWVYSWKNKMEEREIQKSNGDCSNIHVRVSVKEKVQSTLHQLVDEFTDLLKTKLCRHVFNITHQYKQMKTLKEGLADGECVIHIDFSENYGCKHTTEVQSMHFGASRKQVSLHTGVMYLKGKDPFSFCTMSENTRHDPCAIWAHLHPIIEKVKSNTPSVHTVHFLSDGPTTQYRSRKHFFLLKHKMHEQYGFENVTWNFTEAGHGKGAPDGVGGLIKSRADQLVTRGSDISNIDDMFSALSSLDMKVYLHKIPSKHISANDSELPSDIKLVPGTLSIHQVVSRRSDKFISTRVLSCFCKGDQICDCYGPKQTVLHERQVSRDCPVEQNSDSTGACQSKPSETNESQKFHIIPVTAESLDEHLVGKWVVVLYDDQPYPGIIEDVDKTSVQVKVLHCIGDNRFFWPLLVDDIWYNVPEHVLTLIPELLPVTKRHLQIRPDAWHEIKRVLNLD